MFLLLYIYYNLLTHAPAIVAPINNVEPELVIAGGNLTALTTEIAPGWTSSATQRGTADILWSCIVTLSACIYTAIHLDVPSTTQDKWAQLWRRIKWAG